jgi:hypothetical protein
VVSAEAGAGMFKEGTQSAHFTTPANTTGYSYCPVTVDGSAFSTGEECTESDYVRFWLRVTSLASLSKITLYFDLGDGTFKNDFFSYTLKSPTEEGNSQILGFGSSVDVITEETAGSVYPEDLTPATTYLDPKLGWIETEPSYTKKNKTMTMTKLATKAVIPSVVTDQSLSFWQKSDLFVLRSATWHEIKIPKQLFQQTGDLSKDWSDVISEKIEVTSSAAGASNVYFDALRFVGGSELIGGYWFMYSYGRMDSDGNVIHQSAPSMASNQYNIYGPVNFDRHPLTYAARPLSTDAQVNCGVITAIGGSLSEFWEIAIIEDNTTVTDTLYNLGDAKAVKMITNKRNDPAPPGTSVALFRNKIWMVGDPTYPGVLRSSSILKDGSLAPEAWPTREAYEMAGNTGNLTDVQVINKQLVVKGEMGEWVVKVLDPADYLSVTADRVSELGLLGQDAIIKMETSNIYPSHHGFVESDGNSAKIILPQLEPLIDANIDSAMGVNAGLISYFTYNNDTLGNRTAKIDLYRGTARISNLNNYLFECLEYDRKTDKVYGVLNGWIYILDSGTTNEADPSKELYCYLKSRVYRRSGKTTWTSIELLHNTNNVWFRCEVYVDDTLISSFPFRSTKKTFNMFRLGPKSGYDFQFRIIGDTTKAGTIYFPIKIR